MGNDPIVAAYQSDSENFQDKKHWWIVGIYFNFDSI